MPGPFPYRSGFGSTPAPAGDITISWHGQADRLQALIDSGASGTVIPDSLVSKLSLRKIDEIRASGFDGKVEIRGVYVADIDFLGLRFNRHPVVAGPNRTYALIGRDILNRYTTTLYGPRREFAIE